MNFHIITLFPQAFDSYINESILARAQKNKLINFFFYNPRDFVKPKKKFRGSTPVMGTGVEPLKGKPYLRIDDKPYGGGPGMVMQAEPVARAIEAALKNKKKKKFKPLVIYLSPSAKLFTNKEAINLSKKYTDLIIVCGRYEGIDSRIKSIYKGKEFSVGNYVLTGGELPAMVISDCISRQLKGVLGDSNSLEESRISSSNVYTRPEVLIYKGKKYKVPKVLLSGNHKNIEAWKKTIK